MRINFDFAVENYYNLVLEICSLRIFDIFVKRTVEGFEEKELWSTIYGVMEGGKEERLKKILFL